MPIGNGYQTYSDSTGRRDSVVDAVLTADSFFRINSMGSLYFACRR